MSACRLRAGSLGAVLCLLAGATVSAQAPNPAILADSIRREIDAGYLQGDGPRLAAAVTLAGRAITLWPSDALLLHYRGYGLFRQATRANGDARLAMLDDAASVLERSAKLKPLAESHIVRWAALGQQITQANAMGMIRIMEPELAQALELGPSNPRVWLMQAVSAYFTPEMWGGGAARARPPIEKAVQLFAADKPGPGLPSWGKAESHAWYGVILAKLGDRAGARREYDAALELEPKYRWVRQSLIPALERGADPFGSPPS